MATYTSKLNLKKPEGNELFNRVQDLNDNWDKIDVHDHDDDYYTEAESDALLLTKVDKETGKSLVSDATLLDLTDGNETTLHKHSATNIPFTPTGSLSSTNVQNALAELDSEKSGKLFATNLVINGDFANGTYMWNSWEATTVSNAEGIEITNTGSSASGYTYQTNKPKVSSGDKIYAKFKFKPLSSGIVVVRLSIEASGLGSPSASPTFVSNPVLNTIYDLSGLSTATITYDNPSHVVFISSPGSEKLQVYRTLLLNLTTIFGSGNEPTKEQMDWIFTERDRLALGHLNGTQELLPMVSLLNLINKKANIAQEAWITPTLLNGWTEINIYQGKIRYRKNNFGSVEIEGIARYGANSSIIFKLPSTYTPKTAQRFSQCTHTNGKAFMAILTNGDVSLTYEGAGDSQVSLNARFYTD